MIEIFTGGESPYVGLKTTEVLEKIPEGFRMSIPESCPKNVFELIEQCWNQDPEKRPSFPEIEKKLKELKENSSNIVPKQI